jgi:hypothetical protein
MQHHSQSIPDDIRSALAGIYNVINLLKYRFPGSQVV